MKDKLATIQAHAFDVFERRFTPGIVELRATEGDGKAPRIGGYAAKFNVRSENMGWGEIEYYEIIEPGFFDNVLQDDVRCLFNHDSNLILGRTASKTTRIAQDSTGLSYECDADEDQSYAKDLIISLRRKDVNQSSFAFRTTKDGQRWVEEGNIITRYLKKGGCRGLYDVSPVTYPAYPAATSEVRGLATAGLIEAARRDGLLTDTPTVREASRLIEIARRRLDLLALE